MYRSEENPSGQPPEWFEAIRAGVLGNRSQFFRFVPENPFYGYNLDGAEPSEAIIANWWRQGMHQNKGLKRKERSEKSRRALSRLRPRVLPAVRLGPQARAPLRLQHR